MRVRGGDLSVHLVCMVVGFMGLVMDFFERCGHSECLASRTRLGGCSGCFLSSVEGAIE